MEPSTQNLLFLPHKLKLVQMSITTGTKEGRSWIEEQAAWGLSHRRELLLERKAGQHKPQENCLKVQLPQLSPLG